MFPKLDFENVFESKRPIFQTTTMTNSFARSSVRISLDERESTAPGRVSTPLQQTYCPMKPKGYKVWMQIYFFMQIYL